MSLIRHREKRQWAPEPFVPPFPGFNPFGLGGTPSSGTAMQMSAVWACVRVIASMVSMMPLNAFTMVNGVRQPIDTPPLFKQPAANTTTLDWVYMLVVSMCLRGNAYGRIVSRDNLQYPTQIELVSPDDVKVRQDASTDVTSYTYKNAPILPANMFHTRAYRMPGLDVGLSPIQYEALIINRDQAIQQFSLGYFTDAPHPASTLESDQAISADEAKTIKERLLASIQGREPLILGAGLSFKPLTVSPEESQFLATQQYGTSEICRIYGVPPQKVPGAYVGDSMTYASVEMANLDILVSTIQWWMTNLEASFATLLPGNKHVKFDPSVLLRTDLETSYKATAIGIASHQLTPDEGRAMRDQPPLTAAQKKELDLVLMTVSPSGMPKALPGAPVAGVQGPPPAPPMPAPADPDEELE
jgi:HK97 family phage portal protein